MQVAPGVYAIGTAGSTVYLLGGAELSLIDAGGPGGERRVIRYVRRLGREPRDLARILLTRADLDHAGALAALVRATGAAVYAHPAALPRLAAGDLARGGHGWRSWLAWLRRPLSPAGPVAAQAVADGAVFPALGRLEALLTAGPSPDHVVYFLRPSRLLLAGDLLRVQRGRLEVGPVPGAAAAHEMVVALRRAAALDPRAVLPAQGGVWRDNVALRLVRLAEIMER